MSRRLLHIVLSAVAVSLPGCEVSREQESALGADAAREIDQQLPLLDDPVVTRYVDSLGRAIAARADARGLEWRFVVVNSDQVNAFALPGGYIYVNRGLIDLAGSMSELAGVLGHEIGHVTERHSVEQLKRQQRTGIGVTLLCILTDVCSSDVARVAINVGGQMVFARFSRAQEAEADSVAVGHVVQAGIDPRGIPAMFGRLMEARGRSPALLEAWFGTHPLEQDRVAATDEQIAALGPRALQGLRRDDAAFRTVQARLEALPKPPRPREIEPGAPR